MKSNIFKKLVRRRSEEAEIIHLFICVIMCRTSSHFLNPTLDYWESVFQMRRFYRLVMEWDFLIKYRIFFVKEKTINSICLFTILSIWVTPSPAR